MMGVSLGVITELLLAILLLMTIGYCMVLNNRLKRFRADEGALRATIAELVAATDIADRAIQSLKVTATEADRALGQRLKDAEFAANDLSRLVDAAERVRGAARPASPQQAEVTRTPSPMPPAPVAPEPRRTSVAQPAPGLRPGFAGRPAFAARGS